VKIIVLEYSHLLTGGDVMGFRFRKSVKIAPGVRLNFGKKSTSFSFGGKGARYTVSSTGRKTASFGIPGTGLSYVETIGGKKKGKDKSNMSAAKTKKDNTTKQDKPKKSITKKWWFWTILVGIIFAIATGGGSDTTAETPQQPVQEEQKEQAETVVTKEPTSEPTVEPEKKDPVPEPEEPKQETESPVEQPKEEAPAVTPPAVVTPQPEQTEKPVEKTYVLNTSTMKFHYGSCSSVKDIKDHNRSDYTGSRDDLISKGYAPCGRCHP
jgi:hypothetical protein